VFISEPLRLFITDMLKVISDAEGNYAIALVADVSSR
jgi:hypothetical protein